MQVSPDCVVAPKPYAKKMPIIWTWEVSVSKLLIDKKIDEEKTEKRMVIKRRMLVTCTQGDPPGPKQYRVTPNARYRKDGILKYSVCGRKKIQKPWWEGGSVESEEFDKNENMPVGEFVEWLAKLIGPTEACMAVAELETKGPND